MKHHVVNYHEANNIDFGEWIECEVCGETAVDIHHKKLKSQGGTDDADNLIAVCRTCHNQLHGIK
jgi:5-methylcytosine-specific restriction endonuclease McrA